MSLDKLANQLRRDLAANPKKAAALGLMVAVALVCWGPLVWGWLKSAQEGQADQAQLAKLILTDDPAEPTDKAQGRAKARFRWERVRPILAQDPYMASASFDAVWTDPFGLPASDSKGLGESLATSATSVGGASPAEVDPSQLGLVLSSVAIGPKRRGATISGEHYSVGDTITIGSGEGNVPVVRARVKKITHERVELEYRSKSLVLRLERPSLANGDAIERGVNHSEP